MMSALAVTAIAGVIVGPHADAGPPPPPGPAGVATGPLPSLLSVEQVVHAPGAWMSGAAGQGVDVAVLDTGVTPVQGLDAPNKVVYGPDLSFDSQDPKTADLDGFGHGTAMASIIAGNDGVFGGFAGVAPNARIVSVKVGASNGAVDVSQIIAGIDWVTEHAHDNGMNIRVLNLSLGTSSDQAWQIDPLAQAAENAWDHGIVVVASAGNDGSASHEVADPASDPYVLTVGAEDPQGTVDSKDDTVPDFSQRGTGKRRPDVVAPGAYVMGLNVPNSTLANAFPGAVYGRYLRGSGTSQAAAVTSGAVADVLSVNPTLTPDQVKAALMDSADKIREKNPNFVGAGLVDVPGALAAAPREKLTPQKIKGPKGPHGPKDPVGSLEAARGDSHIQLNGVTLTGEQDIFGNTWTSNAMQDAEAAGATWSGGVYNGATWSGATWSSATWSGATWSGATWSGATWSGATWSGATWSGATFDGATWSGATWSSATWSGATWSGATWSGATWSGATWSGATWS